MFRTNAEHRNLIVEGGILWGFAFWLLVWTHHPGLKLNVELNRHDPISTDKKNTYRVRRVCPNKFLLAKDFFVMLKDVGFLPSGRVVSASCESICIVDDSEVG